MNSEFQPQFENDLAAAAQPTEVDVEQIESHNDPARSLEKGLITLYKKHLTLIDRQREEGLIDREKADELTDSVLSLVNKDGLRNEVGYTSREKAQKIMGQDMFFGPEQVKNAGIEINEEIQVIPFNPEDLERAKELGQMLIYRTSTTLKELCETIGPILKEQGKGAVTDDFNWYDNQDFYTSKKIQPGWALVSKELHRLGPHGKNYLQQSEFLAEYLINEVFKGRPLPVEYQAAIDQLNTQKEAIQQIIYSNNYHKLQEASQMLADLRINQFFRQSPAEVIYDCLIYLQNTGERLHESNRVWTSARFATGMVYVGMAGFKGAYIDSQRVQYFLSDVGVSFTRRGSDLKS